MNKQRSKNINVINLNYHNIYKAGVRNGMEWIEFDDLLTRPTSCALNSNLLYVKKDICYIGISCLAGRRVLSIPK